MPGALRVAIGSTAGAIVAFVSAPLFLPLFDVPDGGVGFVTVHHYPKGWDYAVVALIVVFSWIGGMLAVRRRTIRFDERPADDELPSRRVSWILAAVVFVVILFVHDQPYVLMDMFHEGEHLTPAFVMRDGGRPHGNIFLLHGLAVDGGLDALFMGDPPSPWRVRRMNTLLNAATLALLVPLAAELCVTTTGLFLGVLLSLAALGAGQAIGFPYFRLAPLLIAAIALLRYARIVRLRWLVVALSASTLGLLWSLDTGMYAVAATGALAVLGLVAGRRMPTRAEIVAGLVALILPLVVLLLARADLGHFLKDSFVLIPASIDAVWSLPMSRALSAQAVRFYGPLLFYGMLLALAWKAGPSLTQRQMVIVAIFSILLFRTAAGRVSWSHTRYAMPFIGIAAVAFLIEPLLRRRRSFSAVMAALPFLVVFEVGGNITYGAKSLAAWPSRQKHEGLVRYPLGTGKGLYTTPENAAELAALNGQIAPLGPDATFLDFSGERALYYFLQRRPPVRCPDIPMLSNPVLLAEAMEELRANPPACVIVSGEPVLGNFDGVSNATRVPRLAQWIDEHYPRREQIGRFTVGLPAHSQGLAAIVVEADRYVLRELASGRGAAIEGRFTAPADADAYVMNCNGALGWGLQRRVGDEWVNAWVASMNACLSPPIVVPAGTSHDYVHEVWPDRETEEMEPGTYRIVWYGVLRSFDAQARPFGEELPLEQRVSNAFVLDSE